MDEDGAVVAYSDYYPFGLEMGGRTHIADDPTRENFTGHELDSESEMLYAGARYYDSVIGRWPTVDPLAQWYPSHSPYNYVLNNPLKFIDPDGQTVYYVDGAEVYDDGSDNGLVVHTTADIIDQFTEDDDNVDWDGVRNADGSSAEIVDSDKYGAWKGRIVDAAMEAYDGAVKVSIDNKGNVSITTPTSALEFAAYALAPFAISRIASIFRSGLNIWPAAPSNEKWGSTQWLALHTPRS